MYGIGYISRTLGDSLQVGNGLGKPTIKFEFEDNQALADFLTKTKENVDYAETVDADTFSNPLNVNNRRQSRKAAHQKALTDTSSNYLPPSDGTPSLPPSPTSPKALPPSPTTPEVEPLPSFDAVLKNDLDKSDWNRIGFKVGNVGYINDKLQYLDIYVPRYYDIIENWMKYAEYLYPNFVVALCRTKKDKWIFAFDAKKYSKFLRRFYDNGTKNMSFTQRFVFVYDVDLMEQVVKHFNDNGMQVALFYRQVYDGDQPEIITHQKAALPPYVASELPTEPEPQSKPTTPEVEPQSEPTEPEVTAESVTDEEIETSNVTPVEIDWKAFEDAFAKASNWSSFDPERSARSYVGGYKEYYDQYVKQVPPQYLNAFNWFVKRYVSDLISKRSRTASAAVTGPGGITAQKAASLNRANDRFMTASVEFPHALLKYINKIRLREKRNAFVNSSIDDRYAQRISELKKEINGLMYLKDTYEHIAKGGEIPEEVLRRYAWMSRAYGTSNLRESILKSLNYNLNLQKATFKDKLTREVSKGNVEIIDAIIDYLKSKGLFTNRAEIWQFPSFVRTRRESVERETQRVDAAADDNALYRVEYDEQEDRVKIYFNGMPSDKIRTYLKSNGFRWSPRNKAWQRQITENARRAVRRFESLIQEGSLGKPTIKLEFEDNDELMSLFDTDGISGLTVNDKPAAVFNCPESELDTQGYAPTYRRLPDYSHLIDAADGAKTLKGYGFEKATLDELVNACQNYRQVERLAAHLKDDDEMQSAFNVWHWLHTNVRYNYDTPGEEEIRTPARVWADRERGVDCDCLAVFTACLLICMGYKPTFEIVAFNDSPTYSHIYVNLDGMAIDRVLPVFLARPGNITKTQIMEIPVYSLSGIDGCNTLSGVYASTLAKVQDGTATGEDLNNLRKTEVLLTLKGLDDNEYKLAKILMPYVVTIGDDGKYYFDNAKLAAVAQKVDAELALLKQQNASPEAMTQWLANVLDQLDGVSVDAQTPSDKDTIVVIINPKGCPCHVTGQFVSTDLQTLTPDSSAASTAAATASPSADSPLYATTPAPIATPPDGEGEGSNNTLWWITGGCAAIGLIAALASGSGNKKRR